MLRSLLLLIILFPLAAGAQGGAPMPQVGATLIPATRSLQPGTPARLALRLAIPRGWHIYWQNPGASGLPTTVEWRAPAGFRAGPVEWPYPERQVLNGIIVHTYAGDVILLGEIHPPARVTAASRSTISAQVSFGLCRDVCIPQTVEVSASLPVSDGVPKPDRRWARVTAGATQRIPRPVPGWIADARQDGEGVVLTLTPPAGAAVPKGPVTFFPDDPALESATATGVKPGAEPHLVVRVPFVSGATAPRQLRGVLVARSGWAPGDDNPAMRVDVALQMIRRE